MEDFGNQQIYVWVKALETKVNTLTREVDVVKNNIALRGRDTTHTVMQVSEDVLELRKTQEKLQKTMDLVIRELKQTAAKEEVDTLNRYMQYWNPLNFVTQQDLDRALAGQMVQEKHK